MAKFKGTLKNKLFQIIAIFLCPFALLGGLASLGSISVSYGVTAKDYDYSVSNPVELFNSDFTDGTVASAGNTLSGWSVTDDSSQSNATAMFVDVGTGTSSEGEGSNTTFNRDQETYMLQANPLSIGADSRIFMINSKRNSNDKVHAYKGFHSNDIPLKANSYYIISVLVKTSKNGGEEQAKASVYLSGLQDEAGNPINAGIENITTETWQPYFLHVATGSSAQTVTLDLYLGGQGIRSTGVVFFDDVKIYRYSENAFYDYCYPRGFSEDNALNTTGGKYAFLVSGLKNTSSLIDTSDYNFDFEQPNNTDSTLGESWSKINSRNGHASIVNIKTISPNEFFNLTQATYVGDDLTYNNSNALVLYTGGKDGFVGVASKEFEIKAHGVYKVSFNVKVSEITSGSFYFKVKENDTIYNTYSQLITSDQEDETRDYLPLQEEQTSSISSNLESEYTNNYQTVEFYIKGHTLYDTFVNFEFWLGDSTTSANGCVVIDNITVEYSTDEALASASKSLILSATSSSSIANGNFNSTQADQATLTYPMTATDWTVEQENETYNKSGIVYLYNQATFNSMYAGEEYDFLGAYPGHPTNNTGIDLPNNVYLMYNSRDSYQSITSASYPLSNDAYYKVSFDYYIPALTGTAISFEIVDENGYSLFYQDGIVGYNRWDTAEVYIHTARVISHNIQIIINLGEADALTAGRVYIDNVQVTSSSADEYALSQVNRVDITKNLLTLENSGSATNIITSSPAYDFTVSSTDTYAEGGMISGKENLFGEEFVSDKDYLIIKTHYASEATLTSKYNLTLSSEDAYYVLTFDLATIFDEFSSAEEIHDECNYGVTVTIDGFEPITQILTDGQLKSITVYLDSSTEMTPTIAFTLVSDCDRTIGTALINNIGIDVATASEYSNAQTSSGFGSTTFVAELSEQTPSDEGTEDDSEEDTTEPTTEPTSPWLLISSLIFGLAIIVAIIGFALRHIKIKKIEKIRKENYDRKLSKNHDVILVEAQKRRDQEVQDLMQAKKMLEVDKAKLEENHKAFVKENRVSGKGISKELEKAIKKYNNDIIRLDEKISIISEKIDTVMSAEYLLTLERRIVAEEDAIYKNEKKAYKTQLKEIKKLEKDRHNKPTLDDKK